jgi:hypothetical protein
VDGSRSYHEARYLTDRKTRDSSVSNQMRAFSKIAMSLARTPGMCGTRLFIIDEMSSIARSTSERHLRRYLIMRCRDSCPIKNSV